jgi:hypothetical protein
MKQNRFRLFLIAGVLALAVLACSFSASTANLEEARMARDQDGNQPTTVFSPEETFYCVTELQNAPDDTKVKASWTAVEVEGTDPNMFIDEAEVTSGSGALFFELSNNGPWPVGKYKVDLYLNDQLDQTLEFEVQ